MATPAAARSRGRPPVGERVAVRLPPELLVLIDRRAGATGRSRAATIRSLLAAALGVEPLDGVDRAQIRRMLAMTPAERIRYMTQVSNAASPLRGKARTPRHAR